MLEQINFGGRQVFVAALLLPALILILLALVDLKRGKFPRQICLGQIFVGVLILLVIAIGLTWPNAFAFGHQLSAQGG
jgi:hypothetical protein